MEVVIIDNGENFDKGNGIPNHDRIEIIYTDREGK